MGKQLLEAIDGYFKGEAYRRVCRLSKAAVGSEEIAEARRVSDTVAAPPGVITMMSAALEECSLKYGWGAQWSPEIALAAGASAWGIAVKNGFGMLADMEKRWLKAGAVPAGQASAPTAPAKGGANG